MQQLGSNVALDWAPGESVGPMADGRIILIIDPKVSVPRHEEKPGTELVASTHGWTGWLSVDGLWLKFSLNVVRRR